jgi:hypothetical protein
MFIRKLVLLAAISALGLMSIGVATSSASTFLREGGGLVPNGATITNGASHPAVLTVAGLGAVTCNSTVFNATVGASGGATISGTLNSLSFTSCSDTIPVIDITSCTSTGSAAATLTGTGTTTGTISLNDTKVFCHVTGGTSGCYYTAGAASGNGFGNTLSFNNIAVAHTTGTGDLGSLCGTGATFSVTLTDLKTSAGGTVTLGNA